MHGRSPLVYRLTCRPACDHGLGAFRGIGLASSTPSRQVDAKPQMTGSESDPNAGADDDTQSPRPVTGIVFRQLRAPTERKAARRLLADSGVPPAAVRDPGDAVLYGLWDLAAPHEAGLVGVAATLPPDEAGSVELCGFAIRAGVRRQGLGRRLVAEVADALRSEGAACLVARLEGDHEPAAVLLAQAGFAASTDADGRSTGTDVGYLAL
jgi:GNAT superfamily N-acetyltransferase